MSAKGKHPPGTGRGKAADGRQERLKAALRANLARRKAQSRAKTASERRQGGPS